MRVRSFEAIVRALNDAKIQYIVVGGVAVAAHGYLRHTQDLDLVVRLDAHNATAAMQALSALGYQPRIPVTGSDFADPRVRQTWIQDKGMTVLNLFSEEHRETPIDLFVREPFHFDTEYEAALVKELGAGIPVRIVSLRTLLALKQEAGRPQDLADIHQLRLRQT